jgi:hypothetical protein
VVLHWGLFDWVEEDEPVVVHAHDRFSGIDVLRSSRHVRVQLSGVTVAESTLVSFWRAAEVYVDSERVPTGMPGEDRRSGRDGARRARVQWLHDHSSA